MIEIFRYVRLLQNGISQTSKPGRPVYISLKKDALGLCRVYSFAIGCERDCSHCISETQDTSLCLQYKHSVLLATTQLCLNRNDLPNAPEPARAITNLNP